MLLHSLSFYSCNYKMCRYGAVAFAMRDSCLSAVPLWLCQFSNLLYTRTCSAGLLFIFLAFQLRNCRLIRTVHLSLGYICCKNGYKEGEIGWEQYEVGYETKPCSDAQMSRIQPISDGRLELLVNEMIKWKIKYK